MAFARRRGVAEADLRDVQPRHAEADPAAADVRGPAHQRHGRLLPHVEGQVHAGHAAALRVLAEGDDAVGAGHLRGHPAARVDVHRGTHPAVGPRGAQALPRQTRPRLGEVNYYNYEY